MTDPAADAATAMPDRQQRLRDRIDELEVQLAKSVEKQGAATKASVGTADKLEKARKSLRLAEQEHDGSLARLAAADAERQQYEGELASTRRQLDMASIVRKARA